MTRWWAVPAAVAGFGLVLGGPAALAQPPFGGGKGGFGFGPFGGGERKLVTKYDADGDGRLDRAERAAARADLKNTGGGKFGMGGMKGGFRDPPQPGRKLSPADVPAYPDRPLYDGTVLRTLFLEFENADWEAELEAFHGSDVEVPCTVTADGKRYANVGVHFRGMSSYMGVPAGYKRSLNLSFDFADKKQKLLGYATLNLLNNHDDPSQLSAVLYSHVARRFTPAPSANLVRVVINGECWGVYTNVQQFDKTFLAENYGSAKGTRWKVKGSPGGAGGLDYLGDDLAAYKGRYTIKGGDDEKAWRALANLCKVLAQTPPDRLEAALRPICDVDSLLWFLALDVALINNDGYWVRASDFTIFLDEKGKFHFVPHDMNEAFRGAMGGPGGGPGGPFVMRLGRPGEVLPAPLVEGLGLSDDQRQQLAALQKDVDAKLEGMLTPEQRKKLKDLRDGPPGFGPPGGPGGFGPPPGFPGFGPPGGPGFGPPGGPPGGPGGFGPPGGPPMGPPGGFPGGPGGFGPPGGMGKGGGVDLDPLVALDDPRKPLRSKVLAVPALKAQYLGCVRAVAAELDWAKLGPVVASYRALILDELKQDTRKLDPFEAFDRATADTPAAGGGGRGMSLRAFADARRAYLLGLPAVRDATPPAPTPGVGKKK